MRVLVEINGNVFLKGRLKFCLQDIDKSGNSPVALVVLLTAGNEDVVFESGLAEALRRQGMSEGIN